MTIAYLRRKMGEYLVKNKLTGSYNNFVVYALGRFLDYVESENEKGKNESITR